MTYVRSLALLIASLAAVVILLASRFAGLVGVQHLALVAAAAVPGLPLGWRLFGRGHPAAWITGALLGYALTGAVLWASFASGLVRPWQWVAGAAAVTVVTLAFGWRSRALVDLPAWGRRDTLGLTLTLWLVPALVAVPYSRIAESDARGNQQYRSYFTADFVWHMALTTELARGRMPPRDPYAAPEPLHYYWTYFLLPAADIAATSHGVDFVRGVLEVNALAAGLLFVACVWLFAWAAVGHGLAATFATGFAVLCSSLEGLYAITRLVLDGARLSALRNINVDAVTLWFFQGLTIDGLPRALWYTPQHAQACALGLVALIVPTVAGVAAPVGATLVAGLALGLAVLTSPFLGGLFSVVFGLAMAADLLGRRPSPVTAFLRQGLSAVPVIAAVAAATAGGVFAGVSGAMALGYTGLARSSPLATIVLAVGPLLALAVAGAWLSRTLPVRVRPAVTALAVALPTFFFVSLSGTDPVWVGWRAGNLLLVTLPALAAVVFRVLLDAPARARRIGLATCGALALAALPTTVIDAFNAQDVANRSMGPGYRWTLVLTPHQQAGFAWIRRMTLPEAIVQMEPTERGRDGWTNIPSFAQRAMAAGLPISLVGQPYYPARAREVREIYKTTDAARAWIIARRLGIDYLWVDQVDRARWPAAALDKFTASPAHFLPVFTSGPVAVIAVLH